MAGNELHREFTLSATSGRSPRARSFGRGEPLKDRFAATSLELSSARLGQERPVVGPQRERQLEAAEVSLIPPGLV